MDSQTILKSFLNDNVFAPSLLSKEKFYGHFKSQDPRLIEFLYEQALLFKQQQTEELNKQAADNFEVPELDVSGEPIGKYTLEELIGQMSELSRVLDEEIDKTDELCVEELRDIDERIGNLIDLKYGKGGYNESIVEAVKGLEELEKVVDKSTEML